jgi:hypothetical protein
MRSLSNRVLLIGVLRLIAVYVAAALLFRSWVWALLVVPVAVAAWVLLARRRRLPF